VVPTDLLSPALAEGARALAAGAPAEALRVVLCAVRALLAAESAAVLQGAGEALGLLRREGAAPVAPGGCHRWPLVVAGEVVGALEVAGVPPDIMGIGPAPAIRQALKRADLQLSDLDRVEVNEAFSAQYLAVEKELGLDREKTNVNGGAISIGHPLAASGARLAITLIAELRRHNLKYGAASLCIGGGQGIAAIFENVGF